MAKAPGADTDKTTGDSNAAETLKTRSESEKSTAEHVAKDERVTRTPVNDVQKRKRLLAFRPGHKAMFIGLGVVVVILAINAAVLGFLLKKESANQKALNEKGVSISPSTLSKLGVNDTQIGSSNEKLIVDPNAQFNSQITVAGDASIGGQLHLNSTLNASSANLSQLQAGNTQLNQLNVNGSATASTLAVRGNFAVNGAAQFQNAVTIAQLLSVANSAAVANNLSVGGQLSTGAISVGNIVISSIIQEGGHVMTAGASPSISRGSAVGTYGTVSISGNDISGTINVTTDTGPSSGPVASIRFHSSYSTQPVIVISSVNGFAEFYIVGDSTGGFDIYSASSLAPSTSYQINYMVDE